MNDETTPFRQRGSRAGTILLLVAAVLGLGAWRGWAWWQARDAREQAQAADAQQQSLALEARIDALRGDQRAQAQRLQDAIATNRVLRDEVLGLSQRGALLEESVARLSNPDRNSAQALRLDEVELALSMGLQRLVVARDVNGARQAYALAAGLLDGIDDLRMLNLKQTLAQEQAELGALGNSPMAAVSEQLDALASSLAAIPGNDGGGEDAARPAWQRLLAPLVEVRSSRDEAVLSPSQRAAGEAAMQIELGLARAALERGDAEAFRSALARIEAWLPRLWPDSPALRDSRARLEALREQPLQPALPLSGSTLQQLRALRRAGSGMRAAPPVPPASRATAVEEARP